MQNPELVAVDPVSQFPEAFELLRKDFNQSFESFNQRLALLQRDNVVTQLRAIPFTRCEIAREFYEVPTIDTTLRSTWSEQVLTLNKKLDTQRVSLASAHEANLAHMDNNVELTSSVLKTLADSGLPVDVTSAMGVYAYLREYCPIDDGYELCNEALNTYEGHIRELRHSKHTVKVPTTQMPAFDVPVAGLGPSRPAAGFNHEAHHLACEQEDPLAFHHLESRQPVEDPRVEASQTHVSVPRRQSSELAAPATAAAPVVPRVFPHPAASSLQASGPDGAPVPRGIPQATKSHAIRQPATQPQEVVQGTVVSGPRVPSWPSRQSAATAKPAVTPAGRLEPVFEDAPVLVDDPQRTLPRKFNEPAAPQVATAAGVPSVFRTMRQGDMSNQLPQELQPQSPSAVATPESPEAAAMRRLQNALGRLQKIYGAERPDALKVVEAMCRKHKYAGIAAWLSFCFEGRHEYIPRMRAALEQFVPESNQDHAIVSELEIAIDATLNEGRNAFLEIPFSPSLVHGMVPRSVQNDLREIAPLLVV